MSWIHINDLCGQILFLINNPIKHKIYNAVAASPVTNAEFTKTLGSVLNRPTFIPVPAFAPKLFLGELSQVLIEGQRVFPENFLDQNYKYQFPNLELALKDLLT